MSDQNNDEKELLEHHKQLPLCTTRLPYRQGQKLTAVKVYTINNESNHLLVFGVPSLNLRQEAKTLFLKFGKLLQFKISSNHPAEQFTETYQATYEKIQSARIAKKMLDTKNFYGGCLHVCYAPEFETILETKAKLLQRKKDVLFRLKNLQKEEELEKNSLKEQSNSKIADLQINSASNLDYCEIVNELECSTSNEYQNNDKKLNMGERNVIYVDKKKKNSKEVVIEKRFKPYFKDPQSKKLVDFKINTKNNVEVVDCTSAEKEIISNINEALNYNKFGNEIIKKVELKPLNTIVYKNNKKS